LQYLNVDIIESVITFRIYNPYPIPTIHRLQKEEALKVRVVKADEANEKEKVMWLQYQYLCSAQLFLDLKIKGKQCYPFHSCCKLKNGQIGQNISKIKEEKSNRKGSISIRCSL